eukprot:GSMAST32.ASY1.ANO1.443.1 assembled CDS
MESLTAELKAEAIKIIDEVDSLGGMAAAIEQGMPKMRIEESSAKKQARIDTCQDVVVGVNKYRLSEQDSVDVLSVDNSDVFEKQVKKLNHAVENALQALRDSAALQESTGSGSHPSNLLHLSIIAAKARCTVGEISDALESQWGRHKAVNSVVDGAYSSQFMAGSEDVDESKDLTDEQAEFASTVGRRPRMLVAKMGQDGHDRGAKVIATGFADLGFDVDVGPLFNTPEEVARQAVDADVHVVGVIVCGGVIPPQDYTFLQDAGVSSIFGPGTRIPSAAAEVLQKLKDTGVSR